MPDGTAHSRVIELENPALPIACPNKDSPVWYLHPRIYLDPMHEDMMMCPYCGTIYRIKSKPGA